MKNAQSLSSFFKCEKKTGHDERECCSGCLWVVALSIYSWSKVGAVWTFRREMKGL